MEILFTVALRETSALTMPYSSSVDNYITGRVTHTHTQKETRITQANLFIALNF